MRVKRVESAGVFFQTLEKNREAYGLQTIGSVNWPNEFPDKPDVEFAIAHTGDAILLKFYVREKYTLARVTEDNGKVWTDSCAEFFINFDETGYYNFEFNPIGKMLLGFRKQREVFVHADQNIIDNIIRKSSLGSQPFVEKRNQPWELTVEIPLSALFKHKITSLSGVDANGNFYKCGDNLTLPHFLSWNPIENPTPDFHLEKFFGEIGFE